MLQHCTMLHRSAQCCNVRSTQTHLCCNDGRAGESVIAALVGANAALHAIDEMSYTPLHRAAEYENEAAVGALIRLKADVHATKEDGTTPLFQATPLPPLPSAPSPN